MKSRAVQVEMFPDAVSDNDVSFPMDQPTLASMQDLRDAYVQRLEHETDVRERHRLRAAIKSQDARISARIAHVFGE